MKNYTTSMGYNANRKSLLAVLLMLLAIGACKKPEISKGEPASKLLSAHANIAINIEDMVAKIPKTLLYNMGDSLHLYLDRAQWRWESSCLKVRIPMSLNSNSFLCGIKYYDKPDETLVYISQFIHDRGSSNLNFSGMQIWVDLQDWNVYGLQYKNDSVVAYSDPIQLADPGWEQCALESGAFGFNEQGKIVVKDSGDKSGEAQTMLFNHHSPWDCYGENNFWDNLGNFFGNIGDWLGDTGQGIVTWLNDTLFPAIKALLHPGIGGGSNGNPDTNGPGGNYGPGGTYPGGGSFPGGGIGDGGGSGGTGGGYYNPGGGTNDPNDTANTDPPIHGGGAAISWPGGTQINPVPTPFPVFEQPDSNGFYPSRIAALEVYLQTNPTGLLDCDMINAHPNLVQVLQEIGSYEPPASVLNHIDNIRSQNSPVYNDNNFYIQKVEDGNGVVNCDYFPVIISQLPTINGVQLTPLQFLDLFRKNIDLFISPNQNTSFYPYIDYNASLPMPINETTLWNQPYNQSLGALVRINLADNGSVVESDYNISGTHNYFTFTTMATPIWMDGTHPVAGNRRFGIFPNPNGGGYIFYISGVDRCYGSAVDFLNSISWQAGFNMADNLWSNIQVNMKDYINAHAGSSSLYSSPQQYETIRPQWTGIVKEFLLGHITFQQMKDALHCP